MTRLLRTLAILLLASAPAFAWQPPLALLSAPQLASAVTAKDLVVYQGQAVSELLPATGLATSGRGLRAHIRNATPTATVIQILTHDGAANARVAFEGSTGVRMTIGAAVSALWLVGADRVEWVYDVESYSLTDADDVIVTHRGKFVVYGNRTRESDVTPSAQMPSGDGRYVRFDGAQTLTSGQKAQARDNIGAGSGGGAGAWGDITGTLSAQTDLQAALDLKAPLASPTLTGTPAAPTATGGTSTTQIATTAFVGGAVSTHAAATDPHADRAYADSAVSTHNAVTTAHGISAFGSTLVDDVDAAAARTTLGAQAVLVSGTNIKTVNSTSLLGSGDIAISASAAGSDGAVQIASSGAFAAATGMTAASRTLSIAGSGTWHKQLSLTNGVDTLEIGAANQYYSEISANYSLALNSLGLNIRTNSGPSSAPPGNINSNGISVYKTGFLFGRHAGAASITPVTDNKTYIIHEAQVDNDVAPAFLIAGGAADPNATTNLTGGSVTINGGAGASASSGAASGGDVIIAGGTGYGTGSAGRVTIARATANGLATAIATKTASYTLTVTDATILADATSAALTMTLPACASVSGSLFVIKKTDSSGNAVTIDGNASETIDGATTLALATQWKYAHIQCDGTSWYVIGSN